MAEEQGESLGENIGEGFGRIEQFIEDNQRQVLIGAAIVALIVVALIYVFAKYIPEQNLKAQKAIYMAEFAFGKDSFALALNGNQSHKGFKDVADKYSLTHTGNLANYYAGICCLNLKQYDNSIKYLDKFNTSDAIIGALRLNALGDAYAEKGNLNEGISYYEKAADFSDNEAYTPYFLLKTGMALEKQKKYAEAQKDYEKIRDKYPTSDEGRNIEEYVARAKAEAGQ